MDHVRSLLAGHVTLMAQSIPFSLFASFSVCRVLLFCEAEDSFFSMFLLVYYPSNFASIGMCAYASLIVTSGSSRTGFNLFIKQVDLVQVSWLDMHVCSQPVRT
jgi:hypothetical protein